MIRQPVSGLLTFLLTQFLSVAALARCSRIVQVLDVPQATLPGLRSHAHQLALRRRCRCRAVVGRAATQPAPTTRAIHLGF